MPSDQRTTDVLVVGSGAAGLVAALTARARNLRTVLVERSDQLGGASACSGGALWIPNNPISQAAGVDDSHELARQYLAAVVGDAGPAASRARQEAFLRGGPEMVAFLAAQGFRWRASLGCPDAYPERPGGRTGGRTLEGEVWNAGQLGPWRQRLQPSRAQPSIPLYNDETARFALQARTLAGLGTAARALALRLLGRRVLGQHPVTGGHSLVGQLLALALQRNLELWTDSPLVRLIVEAGRVVGAVVAQPGQPGQERRIRAERGVLLTGGGFARNLAMRRAHQEAPIGVDWSSAPPTDLGDAVRGGLAIGAATALMDDAWWAPTLRDPIHGTPYLAVSERALPHSLIVDATGARFMNEAEPPGDAGHHQYARHRLHHAIPAWLILDARHRRRYPFANLPPGLTPPYALDSGFLTRARSLEALAAQIGVDPAGLARTVARFNAMARAGLDEEFGRGRSAHDRALGDPRCTPNPNLGPLERAPFYAARLWPGDQGTKGGLLTDEHARVIHTDGSIIPGLYAAGHTAASVMGRSAPGTGASLAAATTFAYLAVNAMALAPDTAVLEPDALAMARAAAATRLLHGKVPAA